MKKNKLLQILALGIGLMLFTGNAWGQAKLPLARTTWNVSAPTGWTDSGTGSYTTSFACTGNNSGKLDSSGDYYLVNFDSSPGEMIFKLKSASMGGESKLTVEESADGISWTSIGDFGTCGSCIAIVDCDDITLTLNSSSRFVKWTYTKASGNCVFDDVSIASGGSSPLITVAPTSLTGFTYLEGSGPSAEQSFTVEGSDLTADITVTPLASYEISETSGSGFTGSAITLTQIGGIVGSTTIYVRLKAGLAIGTYNEDITATSMDATPKTVTCSGEVTAPPPPDAPVATAATAVGATGFTANWEAVSGATGYFIDVYTGGAAVASDLFISEYVEGSGSEKYIEVYNGTGSSVDLSDYKLQLYANGSSSTTNDVTLSGTLPNGSAIVYKNSSATLYPSGINNASVNFNGDDAVALYKISTSSFVDIFGRIGNDPGSAWTGDGGYTTVDKTLIRKSSVTAGITVNPTGTGPTAFTTLTTEWDMYDKDVIAYLGSHTMGGGNVFVLENESVGNVTSYAVSGLDPATTYYYVVRAANAYGASANSNEIEVTTQSGAATPVITSPTATNITDVSATLGGNITSDGGSAITERGTVWNTTPGVTISDNKLAEGGTSTGEFSHNRTSLPAGTQIFYRAYATNGSGTSLSDEASFYTMASEPTNHPTGFAATANASNAITVVWDDAVPAADGYLIKGSATSYEAIVAPADGTPESDGGLVKNIAAGVETHQFFGLSASTQYFFKIYPYNGSGALINYLITGAPETTATTDEAPEMPKLIISEVADPGDDYNGRFVELYNAGNSAIVFNTKNIYFSIQSNGGNHASIKLTGVIAPKQTYVIGNSANINTIYGFPADLNFGSVNGNGNDGYFLFFGGDETTGILMDAYGVIDVDGTGQPWFYEDARAVRNSNITSPNATWTASEWTITPANVADMTPGEHNGNVSWKGGAGNWNAAANWSHGAIPGNTSNVIIPSGASLNVNVPNAAANSINLLDGAELTINTGQALSVTGTIIVEDGGSFINNGTLGNAAKADADAVMQRNIPAYSNDADGWHLLASPVNSMIIAGSDFEPGTGAPDLDDFYAWDEVGYQWLNYKVGANNITSFENGKGYLVSYQTTATKDFTGTFNNSDITLTNLSKTAGKGDGWHLLGNPFQSALKWETANWNLSSIAVGAKIMNPGGTYTDIAYGGANEYIPANQGFFVQATAATNNITIPVASREHNSTTFYKSEKQNLLTLRASDGEFYVETWIQMMDGATAGYDENFDIRFLGGMYNAPHLYSLMTGGDRLSTNRIGDFEEEVVVPLGFKSFLDREFTLTAYDAGSFGNEIEVYLVDSENDLQINLKQTPEYTFAASANEMSERFNLLFLKSTSIHEADRTEQISIYAHGSTVYLNSRESLDARVSVYNITGQQVHGQRMTVDGLSAINLNLPTGWYVVTVTTDKAMTTQKVFIR